MGLKATTVRMSEDLWNLLEEEAARQGISAAHLVRDAVLLRLGHLSAARGDTAAQTTVEQLARLSVEERRRDQEKGIGRLRDPRRMEAVHRTGLVDGPPDAGLETLAQLCAKVLAVPVSLISLVTADRQFFAASCGLPQPWAGERQTRLSHSFCQHVVVSRQPFVVSDARSHPLVSGNLAIRDLKVVAYAGVPLIGADDEVLGSFCAIDHQPRAWAKSDLDMLRHFASSAIDHIRSRSRLAA